MSRIPSMFLVASFVVIGACGAAGCSGPPVSHPIESTERAYCLSCHEQGVKGAPKMPHSKHDSCVSCHEPSR